MSKQGVEAFAAYLKRFVSTSGKFPDQTTLARHASISPSTISRYINGLERPSLRTLERLAPHMGVSARDLVAIAYPENNGSLITVADVDPLIGELALILTDDSPLPDEDRDAVRALVDRIIAPHRRQLKRRRPEHPQPHGG